LSANTETSCEAWQDIPPGLALVNEGSNSYGIRGDILPDVRLQLWGDWGARSFATAVNGAMGSLIGNLSRPDR
jgi:hypothetical protein